MRSHVVVSAEPSPIHLSQEKLAFLVNLSRNSVIPILHELVRLGFIEVKYGSIAVVDAKGLAATISGQKNGRIRKRVRALGSHPLVSSTPDDQGIGHEPAQALVFIWLGGSKVTSAWLTWQFGVLNSTPSAEVLPLPFTTPL